MKGDRHAHKVKAPGAGGAEPAPGRGIRVAVVGGSIGGLTAALLLRDLGCEVQVFERARAALQSRGAGIVVHPMTTRYLVERGLAEVDRVTVGAACLRYLGPVGEVIFEEAEPYRFTGWNTIYRTLRRGLPASRYHLGRSMTGFGDGAGGTRVAFAGGDERECDLLVCADGISSTARSQVLPEVRPAYSGYVGWRGTVAEARLGRATRSTLRDAIVYHVMAASHVLVYPIPAARGSVSPGRRLMNFVWYRNVAPDAVGALMTDRQGVRRELSVPPGAVKEEFLSELRRAAQGLPDALAEVVLRSDDPFIQPVMDVEVPRVVFGRACLLGDAAFTARPHAAAGTAKAAADAWALSECIAAARGDVDRALAAWEPGRLELGRRLVARSREMGERSQFLGTWRPQDRDLRFGLWGPGD
ncbi:MAG: FAD-dependent monooxygenase [Candidatus Dormibacterales bacterium]